MRKLTEPYQTHCLIKGDPVPFRYEVLYQRKSISPFPIYGPPEVEEWLEKNVITSHLSGYRSSGEIFVYYFLKESDATLFELTWT